MSPTYTLYHGRFIQLPRQQHSQPAAKPSLDIKTGVLWVSNADGTIHGFDWSIPFHDDLGGDGGQEDTALNAFVQGKGWTVVANGSDAKGVEGETVEIVRVARKGKNSFFFPGFIDTHIHASQYPNAGIFGSSTLLDWLKKYTFPMEKSFGSVEKAAAAPPQAHTVYNKVISRTLSHGTTTASYFATIHVPATKLLAALCHRRGQRAFIGRVCMDNLVFCPEDYHDASADESITATQEVIQYIQTIDPDGKLVAPIVTPRFAPTCSHQALSGLGQLASSYNPPLHIQTHISENKNEVVLVKELFDGSESYAQVYDDNGLLTPRTILAHAVHLTPAERALVKTRDAKISHCPASNSALGSGLCEVRTLLDEGITVGFDAQLIELGAPVETLSESEEVMVDGVEMDAGNIDVFGWENWEEKIAKWVWNGDDRNVRAVWVSGRLVHKRA